jgi:hypothetical protein
MNHASSNQPACENTNRKYLSTNKLIPNQIKWICWEVKKYRDAGLPHEDAADASIVFTSPSALLGGLAADVWSCCYLASFKFQPLSFSSVKSAFKSSDITWGFHEWIMNIICVEFR